MTTPTALGEVAALLRNATRVLAVTHVAPDGDAIGSLLGFGWMMEALPAPPEGRSVSLVDVDGVPGHLGFLPGAAGVLTKIPSAKWDCVVALDASDPGRLGEAFTRADFAGAPLVVIDHHITNLNFGTHNAVDLRAAATAQIVLELAEVLGVTVGCEAANCLLTGLVTDTRGFRTSNVDMRVMAAATRLMELGGRLADITQRTLDYAPFSSMRLWGLALEAVQMSDGVIWTSINRTMRSRAGAPENGDSGLVSFLLSVPEAKVALVLNEKPNGLVEIGMRAKPGYDVSALALSLGGGGHPQAAGCTVPGPLAAAEERVLAKVRADMPSAAPGEETEWCRSRE